MIIGLPHSSQSISVGMLVLPLTLAAAAGLSPTILAAISRAFSAPSWSNGKSFSTCWRFAPSSFLTILVLRHLGKLEQPRNGPRLLSRRSIGLPHFSQGTLVFTGGALGGRGFPSLSRLMMVEQ